MQIGHAPKDVVHDTCQGRYLTCQTLVVEKRDEIEKPGSDQLGEGKKGCACRGRSYISGGKGTQEDQRTNEVRGLSKGLSSLSSGGER